MESLRFDPAILFTPMYMLHFIVLHREDVGTGYSMILGLAECFRSFGALDLVFVLNGRQLGLLGAASFAGLLFGAIILGQLSDTFGRKPMFMLTLLLWYTSSFRIIAGFGLGGKLPVASALVQELTPAPVRGRIIVLLELFWSIRCMVSILLAFELTKSMSWRTVYDHNAYNII
ncbi:hypothetical protein THRCLA_09443 [Thraustotheca clavata]|uniref:Major facilitator superfamily (MFS) profile domain-containing protein n=1 Tax=Thraustotheca clavata TaxID=74557 RepID=A0A1V9YWG0_9STRA|nr:hypothetical protein THRCLA_09443 [Thraustotheca clavata]